MNIQINATNSFNAESSNVFFLIICMLINIKLIHNSWDFLEIVSLVK